jgi:hypothetical protein
MGLYRHNSVVLAVYVDDVIITGPTNTVDTIVSTLTERFKLTGGGDAQWCLGVKISQTDNTITLSQKAYIDTILARFGQTTAKPTLAPLTQNLKTLSMAVVQKNPLDAENTKTYQQMIGSIMYLMTSTRPDLTFAVSKLASYLAAPCEAHKKELKHLLRYIKLTRDASLTFRRDTSPTVAIYTDSDHAGSWTENPYSTSGYIALLFGGAIHWKSRRQRVIATSTAEAEVIALSDASHEAVWLAEILKALGLVDSNQPPHIYTDNQPAHKVTTSDGPQRNKSLSLRAAYVRDLVQRAQLTVSWIANEYQKADGFTKILNPQGHANFRRSIGVITTDEGHQIRAPRSRGEGEC